MAHQIKPRPMSRVKPVREKEYLKWLRRQRCENCGEGTKVEAAHTGNRGAGMGMKADDRDAIPLCEGCHRTNQDSYHAIGNEKAWERMHGLVLVVIRERLRTAYQRTRRAA